MIKLARVFFKATTINISDFKFKKKFFNEKIFKTWNEMSRDSQ